MDSNDWHSQWETHAYNFKDGRAHIDFQQLGMQLDPTWRKGGIELIPGPGFGDFSHPTTRLVVKMMEGYVANHEILDVGTGCGILSLAAAALGAKQTFGIDIDPEAIEHAKVNARLNNFQKICRFGPLSAYRPKSNDILLMNMIRSEQKEAMPKQFKFAHAFTSGILEEEQDTYLQLAGSWGYHCASIMRDGGWLGFHLTPKDLLSSN